MKKLRKPKAAKAPRVCRRISEPATRKKHELARQMRDSFNGSQRLPVGTIPITSHLNEILLAMGYEASLVSLLGRKYGN